MIVITADDLGISPGVTRGILEAHQRGVVRSASLLVTYPSSEEAAVLARAVPSLEVGLHLDLVGGRPVSDPSAIRSLVNGDGSFIGLSGLLRRLLGGRVRASEIASELRAQVERARSWGIGVAAWDSHRHTHLLPPVARIVGPLAREHRVRWLRRASAPTIRAPWKPQLLRAATLGVAPFFRGVPGNDWFVDLTSLGPRVDAADVALLAARGGLGELAAHPGHVDDDLRRTDTLTAGRAGDLALLTDPLLRRAFGDDTVRQRVPR